LILPQNQAEKLVKIKVLDQEYRIKSSEEDQVLRVADYLNGVIEQIKRGSPVLNRLDLMVMTAFQAASDYFQAEKELHRRQKEVDDRAEALEAKIEEILAEAEFQEP